MGTPRPPIRLERHLKDQGEEIRLVTPGTGEDYTAAHAARSVNRVRGARGARPRRLRAQEGLAELRPGAGQGLPRGHGRRPREGRPRPVRRGAGRGPSRPPRRGGGAAQRSQPPRELHRPGLRPSPLARRGARGVDARRPDALPRAPQVPADGPQPGAGMRSASGVLLGRRGAGGPPSRTSPPPIAPGSPPSSAVPRTAGGTPTFSTTWRASSPIPSTPTTAPSSPPPSSATGRGWCR